MKVTFDKDGYVSGWCMVGDNGGEDFDPPDDFDTFLDCFEAFRAEGGKLIFDAERAEANQKALTQAELRERRENECFPVINRGQLWYSALTHAQLRELRAWYLAWLDVTKTLTAPERPVWISAVDTSRIPPAPI